MKLGSVLQKFVPGAIQFINSLLSCVFSGLYIAGPEALSYARSRAKAASETDSEILKTAARKEKEFLDKLLRLEGKENPYLLHKELGEVMSKNVTIRRENTALQETLEKINELQKRFWSIDIPDKNNFANNS